MTGEVIYSPPEGAELLREMLANWESFVHAADGLDPLVRMAVAHYQFEAIHPFHDGNGRAGRIINILMLIEAGLIAEPILYLSRFINSHKNDYYRLLSDVTRDGHGNRGSCTCSKQYARQQSPQPRRSLQSGVFNKTFTTRRASPRPGDGMRTSWRCCLSSPTHADRLSLTGAESRDPTATSWLNDLTNAGILTARKFGRDRVFVNQRFLDILLRSELEEPAPSGATQVG